MKPALSERIWNGEQSWHLESLHQVNGNKVQVHIRRNAYDDQSYAEIKVWSDALNTWETVQRLPGDAGLAVCRTTPHYSGVPVHRISYTRQELDADQLALFEEDRVALLDYAALVLRMPAGRR